MPDTPERTGLDSMLKTLVELSEALTCGLAQMASLGQVRSQVPSNAEDASEAVRSDWEKVGLDMRRGIEKARHFEEAR